MKNLQGTKTEKNLIEAFTAESTSSVKYKLFAHNSKYKYIEKIFKEIACQEKEHAEQFLELLCGVGSDADNLKNAIALEGFTSTIDYPDMAKIADEEGFHEIAQLFRDIVPIETRHKETFEKLYNIVNNNSLLKSTGKSKGKFMCHKCGYIFEGNELPNECPVCGHGKENFIPYKEEI